MYHPRKRHRMRSITMQTNRLRPDLYLPATGNIHTPFLHHPPHLRHRLPFILDQRTRHTPRC